MELLTKKEPLKFTWKDVVFLVKPTTTVADKFAVDVAGTLQKDGQVKFSPREFYRALIEQFVVGWEGVTDGGKPVPYSFEALERLPADSEDDVLMRLGNFIYESTDFKTARGGDAKNA